MRRLLVLLVFAFPLLGSAQIHDVVQTALQMQMFGVDSIDEQIRTRTGFNVKFLNARRVSPTKGKKISEGYTDWYLHIIRVVRMDVNGYRVETPKEIVEEVVSRKQLEKEELVKAGGEIKRNFFQRFFDKLFKRKRDSTDLNTDRAARQAARRARKAERQADREADRSIQGTQNAEFEAEGEFQLGTANEDSLRAVEDSILAARDAIIDSLNAIRDSTKTAKKAAKTRKKAAKMAKNGKNKDAKKLLEEAARLDTLAMSYTAPDTLPGKEKPNVQADVPDEIRRTVERDRFMYYAVVSDEKRLKKRMPKEWESRCLFLVGIVDLTDSIPAFRRRYQKADGRLDSLENVIVSGADTVALHQIFAFEELDAKFRKDRQLYHMYRDFRKAKRRKKRLRRFFLSPYFTSLNLKYNILPRPSGLPKYIPNPPEPFDEEKIPVGKRRKPSRRKQKPPPKPTEYRRINIDG